MNVFVLDYDMTLCATMHVDRHVTKMPTEAMQIVSTALYSLDYPLYNSWESVLYKPAYAHHPITKWASLDKRRIFAVALYGYAVATEFTYRYKNVHATTHKFKLVLSLLKDYNRPLNGVFSSMPQAMPDEYKDQSVITAYRKYYTYAKAHLHKWTSRTMPDFIAECRGHPSTAVGA